MRNEQLFTLNESEVLSRRDYQELLLARMAGGDLYANELRMQIREVDFKLDALRIACGEKAIYPHPKD